MRKKIFLIVLLGVLLRMYNLNWDQGYHLHPDERMLIMVANRINFFQNLNPDFFNYGSLPIYILAFTSTILDKLIGKEQFFTYDGMLIVGRMLSVFFDACTLIVIARISKKLFKNAQVILWSVFFYAIAFFPIQNSHFFIVDVFLNFFITVLLYFLISYWQNPSTKYMLGIAISFAAAMATKVTPIIFLPIIVIVLAIPYLKHFKLSHLSYLFLTETVFAVVTVFFHFLFMPYAYLLHERFLTDVLQQTKMNQDPYIFPYTLQYVYTLPYIYYLKNIFLWGLGPIISLVSFSGLVLLVKSISRNYKRHMFLVLFIGFYVFYFLIIGKSAVKFMRYLLPLYPFFTILAGYGMYTFWEKFHQVENKYFKVKLFFVTVAAMCFLWTLMFENIYSSPTTRVTATNWILSHITTGSTLAIEHWDDALPLTGIDNFHFVTLTLYDLPDNDAKWQILNEKLDQTDYIILASNRLYVPLQKLADCNKYRSCYPLTASYYQKLFAGKLGFTKVAEFQVKPTLKIGPLHFSIDDQPADESFTVYDHPKIIIFKKNTIAHL